MKKRTIISLILTIICIIATNKLWLEYIPVPIILKLSGEGEVKVTAFLNKYDNNEFKKVKKGSETFELTKYQSEYKINVGRVKSAKRLKITFSTSGVESFVISEVKVKKKTVNINNYNITNATSEFLNKKIIITPKKNKKVEIVFNDKFDVRSTIKFQLLTFISILVLSFLLFYKLTSYLADFKNIKNQSRIEIVFLTIFFVFLFIPMSHINQDVKSKSENRNLAVWHSFINENGTINYKFGKDFDQWFNDRFNLRSFFVDLSFIIISPINSSKVLVGQDGWLFLNYENAFDDFANVNSFSEEDLKIIAKNLSEIDSYCKNNNKKFVLLIAPIKNKIYGEFYPHFVRKLTDDKNSRTNQLIKYLKKHTNLTVVYPYEELHKNKGKEGLYYKTDSHWSSRGAYIAFRSLMKNLGLNSEVETFIVKSELKKRDLDKVYNNRQNDKTIYNEIKVSEDYLVSPFEDEYSEIPIDDSRHDRYTVNDKAKNNQTLVIYRDSFSNSLLPFLSESFYKVYSLRRATIEKKYIDMGDIIIFEIVERSIPRLKLMKNEWEQKI